MGEAVGVARHTLVLGGARSGKTRRALALADSVPAKGYIATAEAWDDEMRARIAAHKAERQGCGWVTIEAPLALPAALSPDCLLAAGLGQPDRSVLVVDCLTLWLSNLMLGEHDMADATATLIAALAETPARVILVSNEVGFGIVPDNALARRFRDAQGRLNQDLAAVVGTVELVVAGLVVKVK